MEHGCTTDRCEMDAEMEQYRNVVKDYVKVERTIEETLELLQQMKEQTHE